MAKAIPGSKRATRPMDAHVGARVRLRRRLMGMSQVALGTALGVSFQQVQKYEKGTNRISAARLQQIAEALQVSVAWLFEEGQRGSASAKSPKAADLGYTAFMRDRFAPRLMKAFPAVPRPVKEALVAVVESVAVGGRGRRGRGQA